MLEWNDAAQRVGLARTVGVRPHRPISATTFTHSFVADVFTSMPKCFSDSFHTVGIYTTGEAPGTGRWEKKELVLWVDDLHGEQPAVSDNTLMLSALLLWIRPAQCARAY